MSTYEALQQLAAIDRKITILSVEADDLGKRAKRNATELLKERTVLEQLEVESKKLSGLIAAEETKLKEHEDHVIAQRKQLADLGGAKSAKYVEREADLASRAAAAIEEVLLVDMQKGEDLTSKVVKQREKLSALQARIQSEDGAGQATISKNRAEIAQLEGQRTAALSRVDSTAQKLYDRVRTKHPAQPLAVVEGGSCQVCSRSIPAQQANLVLAATTLQLCPGCSRILIPGDQ